MTRSIMDELECALMENKELRQKLRNTREKCAEECAYAVCPYCAMGCDKKYINGKWEHLRYTSDNEIIYEGECWAAPIWDLLEKWRRDGQLSTTQD